jgi:hypothetical protein
MQRTRFKSQPRVGETDSIPGGHNPHAPSKMPRSIPSTRSSPLRSGLQACALARPDIKNEAATATTNATSFHLDAIFNFDSWRLFGFVYKTPAHDHQRSTRACSPAREQVAKVDAVDRSVAVQIGAL